MSEITPPTNTERKELIKKGTGLLVKLEGAMNLAYQRGTARATKNNYHIRLSDRSRASEIVLESPQDFQVIEIMCPKRPSEKPASIYFASSNRGKVEIISLEVTRKGLEFDPSSILLTVDGKEDNTQIPSEVLGTSLIILEKALEQLHQEIDTDLARQS